MSSLLSLVKMQGLAIVILVKKSLFAALMVVLLLGLGEILHGLLAQQDLHHLEHCDYAGIWHD